MKSIIYSGLPINDDFTRDENEAYNHKLTTDRYLKNNEPTVWNIPENERGLSHDERIGNVKSEYIHNFIKGNYSYTYLCCPGKKAILYSKRRYK